MSDGPGSPTPLDPDPAELTLSMQLVRRAQGGESAALDELLARYEDRVRRMATIRMGSRVRSFMDSADLVQNTYMVAVRKLDGLELRSHASIIQWLSKILENQIRDAARYAGAEGRDRGREVPIDGAHDGMHSHRHPAAAGPSPADAVSDAELAGIYDTCVGELEGDFREVVLLRDYAGMSWERIQAELGRPTSRATQQLYQRARIKLGVLLSSRVDLDGDEKERPA
ncbi:MAG: sigma-70 family RNA polymerase sigma factor [bacterium]|nr:sigma-70 family RNA polymerase sigma factor [bacterium]